MGLCRSRHANTSISTIDSDNYYKHNAQSFNTKFESGKDSVLSQAKSVRAPRQVGIRPIANPPSLVVSDLRLGKSEIYEPQRNFFFSDNNKIPFHHKKNNHSCPATMSWQDKWGQIRSPTASVDPDSTTIQAEPGYLHKLTEEKESDVDADEQGYHTRRATDFIIRVTSP